MKPKPLSKYKQELDKIVSQYVRQKYARDGYVKCYTCDRWVPISNCDCGHFISRVYLATRFELDNLRPQCKGCNIFGDGRFLDFEERLRRELGEHRVEELKQMRHRVTKLDIIWYENQIKNYKHMLAELL